MQIRNIVKNIWPITKSDNIGMLVNQSKTT